MEKLYRTMSMSQRVLSFLTIVVVSACGASSVSAEVILPDAEIKAYMAEHHVPAIKPKPKAPLQSAYEGQWLKWFKFAVIDPFMSRIEVDAPVRERALQLVKDGIMLMRKSPQRNPAYTSDKMAAECDALVKAGIDDPLVFWFQSWALHDSTRDFEVCEKLFRKAYEHRKMAEIKPVLRELMLVRFDAVASDARQDSEFTEKGKEIIDSVRLSMQDGTYLPEHDEVLVGNVNEIFRREVMSKDEKVVEEICRLPNLSEWVKLALDGRFHERKAWNARGGDFADKVPDAKWKIFNEEREQAVESFKKAWKLHPDRYDAPYNLLNMTMTGAETGDEGFVWLDRALDEQFDWVHNYRAVLNGLRPRWGGSFEKMLAFGLACVETRRFDTEVPYYFFEAIDYVARDMDDWHSLFRNPLVAKVALILCKQRVLDAPTAQLKEDAFAILGVYAWLCGDYKTAAQAFERSPGRFSRSVIFQLRPFIGWNENLIRGEAAIFAAGMGSLWTTTEHQLQERDYAPAEKGAEAIRAKVGGAGAELASSRLAVIKFERQLAQGEWTSLHIDPSLAGWQIQKGDWEGSSDGALINRGRGTSALIYHQGRVGSEFQIRGEFESQASGLGIILGYGTDVHAEQWVTCLQNKSRAYILHRYNPSSIKDVPINESRVPASFLITCQDGKITYAINGHNVFTQAEFGSPAERDSALKFLKNGRVGFCHYFFGKDSLTRIGKVQVRLLPAGFKPEAPPIIPPPGDMESLQLFKSEKPWVGKIEIAPGYYKSEQKITAGVVDKSDSKRSEAANVVSPPGVQIESADVFIKKGTWIADETLFRRSKVTMELGCDFQARNSLFEECELHKGGSYFVKFYSTKWTFDNCVFSRTFINPWKLVDIGVKVTNCTFYDVDFSGIKFREDAGKEALDEWVTLKNCRFIRCKLPESVVIATKDCIFEACKFGEADKSMPIKTAIKTTIFTSESGVLPAVGPERTIETKDLKALGHPVGATVPHEYTSDRLRFR